MTALQTWRISLPCMYGTPTLYGKPHAPGWNGPHHCFWCWVDVERACGSFAELVRQGVYDEAGYTPAERRAQQRRKAAA